MEETRESKRQRREGRNALEVLPERAWLLVLKKLSPYDRVAFGLTCKTFLAAVTATASPEWKKVALPLRTDLTRERLFEQMPCFSLGWFQWVFRSFKRKKGAPGDRRSKEYYGHLYDSDLMHLAAFQGSKKVMEWLVCQGIPLDIMLTYPHGLEGVTFTFCSGFEVRTRLALGTCGLVLLQLQEVTFTFCSGFEARIGLALGTGGLVLMQLKEAILTFCSGLEVRNRLVSGATRLVLLQLEEVTLMFCSGSEARTRLVIGTRTLVKRQLEEVTLMFCSGLEARIRLALGTRGHVLMQLGEATLAFCSGFEARIRLVVGTSGLVLMQLKEVTLKSCSGFEVRIRLVSGTRRLVSMQLQEATLVFCSGSEARTHLVIGTRGLVLMQLKKVTFAFCTSGEMVASALPCRGLGLILLLGVATQLIQAGAGAKLGRPFLSGGELSPDSDKWAVLVAGSNGFWNYSYQILKSRGFPESNIIVMRYDDIEFNALNPMPGTVINRADCIPTEKDEAGDWEVAEGCDVQRGCRKDYFGAAVSPESFINVLRGDHEAQKHLCKKLNSDPLKFGGCNGKVLNTTESSKVFLAFFDHGGTHMIGFPPEWKYGPMRYVTAKDLMVALEYMSESKMYDEMVLYIEACESGSMFNGLLPQNMSIWATTAADPFHSSYATACGIPLGDVIMPCLGDLYSVNWMQDVEQHMDKETFEDDFDLVEKETNLSQVCAYGDDNIAAEHIRSYLEYPSQATVVGSKGSTSSKIARPRGLTVPSTEASDLFFRLAPPNPSLQEEHRRRKKLDRYLEAKMLELAEDLQVLEPAASGLDHIRVKKLCHHKPKPASLDQAYFGCLREAVDLFQTQCASLSEASAKYLKHLSAFCSSRPSSTVTGAILRVCNEATIH
ncbi:legumain peptidase [Chloropicon primus]|uniref:Legumain peptidase n=1 Tax=Chloropicon primus TaxID=1764295 RepID=A0A5B8MP52_9CHLO|nr:legumain peptidase [Chloropicon primus]|eukprot:QDZ21110.1 legumain peptidase [Chloropicon primus]